MNIVAISYYSDYSWKYIIFFYYVIEAKLCLHNIKSHEYVHDIDRTISSDFLFSIRWHILSYFILYYLKVSYPILSYLILFYLIFCC